MSLEKKIRKLARSAYYQNIYRASQESNGIYLFENQRNFSGIQNLFLYWLKIYNILYDDLALKEYENLTEDIIEDDIRTDAFLYYKQKKRDDDISKQKLEDRKSKAKLKHSTGKTKYQPFRVYQGDQ